MGNAYRSVLAGGGTPTLQSKSVIATTSQQTISPDSGYDGLSSVTVDPQVHDQYYTPTAMNDSGTGNDMGESHNYRYVKTTGMYKPSGTKSAGSYTTNGVKTISGLESYSAASFTVNVNGTPSSYSVSTASGSSTGAAVTLNISATVGNVYLVLCTYTNNVSSPSCTITGANTLKSDTAPGRSIRFSYLIQATSTTVKITFTNSYASSYNAVTAFKLY